MALLLSAKPAIQHSVLIKKGGLSSQPGPEAPIHHHLLISLKCLSTVEVQNTQASICPGPSFCITAGAEPGSPLKLSAGMTGLPPPVALPLASRPFKPAFRPYQCATQAQVPGLIHSITVFAGHNALFCVQTEALSWQGFRAKSSFDTVRTPLPS